MNKFKKISLIAAITLFVTNSMFASFNVDIAMNYLSKSEQSNGTVIDNKYPFSVIFLPSFSSGSFFLELRAPLSFGLDNNKSLIFDKSYYSQLVKETGESDIDFVKRNLSHYFSFINYIKYGYDWDDFNVAFGTIRNATIGDGSIINHYRDSNLVSYEKKSGLKFKLDGNLINLGYVGVEGITDDLFNPNFYGGRVFVRPFNASSTILKDTSLGLTLINSKASSDIDNLTTDYTYQSLALDINQVLFENEGNSISIYYDLINAINTDENNQFLDSKSISWRAGINGRYLTQMSYNIYFKSIINSNVENKGLDINENLNQMVSIGGIPSVNGIFSIYGTTGIYSSNDNNYLLGYTQFDYENYNLKEYRIGLKYKNNSSLLMIKNLNLEAYKTYERDITSSTMKESFFEGITSLKNVALSLQSDVQYGISVFNVGLLLESDDTGKFSNTYKISYNISLF